MRWSGLLIAAKSASLILHPGGGHDVHDVAQVLLVVDTFAVTLLPLPLLGVITRVLLPDVLRGPALVTDVSEESDSPTTFDKLILKLVCVSIIVPISCVAPHTEKVVVGHQRTVLSVLTHGLRGAAHNDSTVLAPAVLH